jgi:MarR family transcriptional regulator for hemolysin
MATPHECARELLEIIPLVMGNVRAGVRANEREALSMPQFGAMAFLRRQGGASLTDLAGHMGLTLPSASKLVDGLVARGVVVRDAHPDDRRRLTLTLTPPGRDVMRAVRDAALAALARRLDGMPAETRGVVVEAMRALRAAFAGEHSSPLGRSS